MSQTLLGLERQKPGALKGKLIALSIGQSFPCPDRYEQNKFYAIAKRLQIRIKSKGGRIERVS